MNERIHRFFGLGAIVGYGDNKKENANDIVVAGCYRIMQALLVSGPALCKLNSIDVIFVDCADPQAWEHMSDQSKSLLFRLPLTALN